MQKIIVLMIGGALSVGYGIKASYATPLSQVQEEGIHLSRELKEYINALKAEERKEYVIEYHTVPQDQGLQRPELRVGFLKQDVKSKLQHGFEQGAAINVEYLWQSPPNVFFKFLFQPRPQVGLTLNTRGSTSAAYLGLSWNLPKASWWFMELSLGGTVHNGRIKRNLGKRKGYGSRVLFRESVSLGLIFNRCHTMAVMIDHLSNAKLASPNPGLTNFGLRYGYLF